MGIRTAEHTNNGDPPMLVVDAVDHAVGTAASTVTIIQRWPQLPAHPMGILQQWSGDELVRRERHRL
jgi:hypothetical protein